MRLWLEVGHGLGSFESSESYVGMRVDCNSFEVVRPIAVWGVIQMQSGVHAS